MRRSPPKRVPRAIAIAVPAPAIGWKAWLLAAGGVATVILGRLLTL